MRIDMQFFGEDEEEKKPDPEPKKKGNTAKLIVEQARKIDELTARVAELEAENGEQADALAELLDGKRKPAPSEQHPTSTAFWGGLRHIKRKGG